MQGNCYTEYPKQYYLNHAYQLCAEKTIFMIYLMYQDNIQNCFHFINPCWLSHFVNCQLFKAAESVTFDLLILKIMFLFFKNAVKILKFR